MKNTNNNNTKAVIAAVIANVIWGFSFMATRVAIGYTSAPVLLSLRFTASFLIMLVLIIFGIGKVNLKGKPLGLFLLMGMCEPVIYFIAETNGIKFTTSSFSGLMISLIPITTALFSTVLIHEHLSLKRFLWITCSVAGVALISVMQTNEGVISIKGILYLLVAILSASFYTILSRSVSENFTSFERTYIMMIMGFAVFTADALIQERQNFIPAFAAAVQEPHVVLPIAFLSLVCSVIAFFCMNYAMTYIEASRAVVFTNIVPVVSVIAGVLILGEPFSFVLVAGILLILTGVYMVNKVN